MDLSNGSTNSNEDFELCVYIETPPDSPCFSDDTWGSFPNSPEHSPNTLEQEMDDCLSKLLEQSISTPPESPVQRRKRGRKPLRPNDPIKKKTEEKDKYWLRAFRAYMKTNYSKFKSEFTEAEKEFWLEHLGVEGKPEKGKKFLSYGKRYKNYLFSNPDFVRRFRNWFHEYGFDELSKKCNPESGLWVVFFNYAEEELVNYVPKGSSSIGNSPVSEASLAGEFECTEEEFFMAIDNEAMIESFLNN